jgi:hypothetical protein
VSTGLAAQVDAALHRDIHPAVAALARLLGEEAQACAVLFYGSNLRTGSLDGVLDFYVLTPGAVERGIWPRVGYREVTIDGQVLRAKIATMTLATFTRAARGEGIDTTIWTRFVQPAGLAWAKDGDAARALAEAVADAAVTAARFAAALGPVRGSAADYWRALFRATYAAELRVEARGREEQILEVHGAHLAALLPAAWRAGGIVYSGDGPFEVKLTEDARRRMLARWRRRQRLGRPLNVVRLVRAAFTFDGAARYAAWKIERHTGVAVPITPFRERHPVLSAPGVLWRVWRARA